MKLTITKKVIVNLKMTISHLPEEIIRLVLEKLENVQDIISMSLSCKKIYNASKNISLKNTSPYNINYDSKSVENMQDAIKFNPDIKLKLKITDKQPIFNSDDLSGIVYLDLNSSEMQNVNAFLNVKNLNLSYCVNLKYVSVLKNLHTLNMSYCYNISDVSALGNVHTLILSCCYNISDVSALGNVHTLDLSYCNNVRDVSMLGKVYNLNISSCYNITDISALGNVNTLNLSNTFIFDFSHLKGVKNLITEESF